MPLTANTHEEVKEYNRIQTAGRERKVLQEIKVERQVKCKRKLQFGQSNKDSKVKVKAKSCRKIKKPKRSKQLINMCYPISCVKREVSGGGDWCRYCGARETSRFTQGPWGPRTLCTSHYVKWKQTKSLDLSDYPDMPTKPINPSANTQPAYEKRMRKKLLRQIR